ncbi:MAG: hypothetical protein ACOVSW_23395, partial [Candidatus Kapaibacteriota bacterium]
EGRKTLPVRRLKRANTLPPKRVLRMQFSSIFSIEDLSMLGAARGSITSVPEKNPPDGSVVALLSRRTGRAFYLLQYSYSVS